MTRTIVHSGREWESLGNANGFSIWPIEEYLVRRKHSPAVAERIKRLNPNGKSEGERPRGWHPHARVDAFLNDVVSIRDFREEFGSAALRSMPKWAFIKMGGKRRAISAVANFKFVMLNRGIAGI